MDKIKAEILDFMNLRPEAIGIIGYGSGVNPQKGQQNRTPQIDLIVIVEDLRKWHKDNIKNNKKDYSFLSRLFFKYAPSKWLKSGGKICYMTYISFKESKYKIGTIEYQDFIEDLTTWETFYIAGRMQKPILIVKADKEIEKDIAYNRVAGMETTKLLVNKKEIPLKDFYIALSSLSYIGDTRMKLAENPDKVKNIVEGSIGFYDDNYADKLNIKNGKVIIDDNVNIDKLPTKLKKAIEEDSSLSISNKIKNFLTKQNKDKSLSQTVKGIFTTGPVKAIKYALEKLKRGRKK